MLQIILSLLSKRLIAELVKQFINEEIEVFVDADNADLLIAQTAIEKCYKCDITIVVGQGNSVDINFFFKKTV